MGTDHPLIWWHCVGQGHAVYSALGHAGSFYAEPLMIQFLDNAMSWGLAESGKGCRVYATEQHTCKRDSVCDELWS
jgi:type 1 glutamine amidotransferase